MTTCAQCLSELSTMRVTDMQQGSATALHLESCPRCAVIAQEITYAERRLAMALAETGSSFSPEELSRGALYGSERERRKVVGRWVRGVLAAAGCVTFFLFMQNVFVPMAERSENIRTATFTLRCMPAEEAMEIATPYLRSSGAIYTTKGSRIITVRGKNDEFAQAMRRINAFDDEACALSSKPSADPALAGSEPVTTSIDKPKKD